MEQSIEDLQHCRGRIQGSSTKSTRILECSAFHDNSAFTRQSGQSV